MYIHNSYSFAFTDGYNMAYTRKISTGLVIG